jgi:hypothetical protein
MQIYIKMRSLFDNHKIIFHDINYNFRVLYIKDNN